MLLLARFLITGLWAGAGYMGFESVWAGKVVPSILWFSLLLLATVPLAAIWTPYIADALFGSLIDSVNDEPVPSDSSRLERWIDSAILRKRRRLVVFLCWIEGLLKPKQPRAFHVGMKHSKPGSRMELFFAREVLRFGNARHVMDAATVFERHGVRLTKHWSVHITEFLRIRHRPVPDTQPPIQLLRKPATAKPKRNPRIRLFSSADQVAQLPPPPAPIEDPHHLLIDRSELGPEAGQHHRRGADSHSKRRQR